MNNAAKNLRFQATTASFNYVFEEHLVEFKDCRKAYEETERDHQRLSGNRKYSDFNSFSHSRNRDLRKKKR
jgi:hypothetical protein